MRSLVFIIMTLLITAPGFAQPTLETSEKTAFIKEIELDQAVSRPDPEGVPTKVSVGVYVIDTSKIHDAEQTFTADFVVVMQWKDRRLGKNAKVRTLYLSNVWHPYMQIKNQNKLKKHWGDMVEVDKNGIVTYRQRFSGDLSLPLNLKDFPFDKHTLSIIVASFRYSPEDVAFEVDTNRSGRAKAFSIAGWSIDDDGDTRISPYYFAPQARNISQVFFEYFASRHFGYYFWRAIFPMMIIVFMSWSVFWISPNQMGAQIAVASTTILTLFAFKFSLSEYLPNISYLTRLDLFITAATIMSFLAFTEVILTSNLAGKDETFDLAFKIDRWCRWVFPIAFALITAYCFWIM
jgi:hypothetical protein